MCGPGVGDTPMNNSTCNVNQWCKFKRLVGGSSSLVLEAFIKVKKKLVAHTIQEMMIGCML